MGELPREWKYYDWGMVIGIILAILGALVTIWIAYDSTREVKRQLMK
jgi:hypothetical protein